jgi:membrane-bound lytic murein transglycosylase B
VTTETFTRVGFWAMMSIFIGCAVWVFVGFFGFQEPDVRTGTFVGASINSAPVALSADFAPADDSNPEAQLAFVNGGNAQKIDLEWATAAASSTGIPLRAVLGYAGATVAVNAEQPLCHLTWTTIAAIGNVESGHGTHADSSISRNGVTQPPIYGPLLDGTAYDAVTDTDGGQFDGNNLFDRAVGPLQFIPSTWERWGSDGNGDGINDPQQIDDAALTTARYLCHYGDLSGVEGWRTAIFAYNHVDSYVDGVAAMANTYAERVG